MRVPTMSAGTRSGVNWMRAKLPPTTLASVSTASVLATPGTPSSRQWPRASSATNIRSIIRSWPTITRLTSNNARSSRPASWAGVLAGEVGKDGGGLGWATSPPSVQNDYDQPSLARSGQHARRDRSVRAANTTSVGARRDTPRKGHAAPLDTGGRFVVNISPSPGGFPRGRPALNLFSGVCRPDPPLFRQRLRRTGRLGPALEQSEAAYAGSAQDLACL